MGENSRRVWQPRPRLGIPQVPAGTRSTPSDGRSSGRRSALRHIRSPERRSTAGGQKKPTLGSSSTEHRARG